MAAKQLQTNYYVSQAATNDVPAAAHTGHHGAGGTGTAHSGNGQYADVLDPASLISPRDTGPTSHLSDFNLAGTYGTRAELRCKYGYVSSLHQRPERWPLCRSNRWHRKGVWGACTATATDDARGVAAGDVQTASTPAGAVWNRKTRFWECANNDWKYMYKNSYVDATVKNHYLLKLKTQYVCKVSIYRYVFLLSKTQLYL